jgi:hypothetical protein
MRAATGGQDWHLAECLTDAQEFHGRFRLRPLKSNELDSGAHSNMRENHQ